MGKKKEEAESQGKSGGILARLPFVGKKDKGTDLNIVVWLVTEKKDKVYYGAFTTTGDYTAHMQLHAAVHRMAASDSHVAFAGAMAGGSTVDKTWHKNSLYNDKHYSADMQRHIDKPQQDQEAVTKDFKGRLGEHGTECSEHDLQMVQRLWQDGKRQH